MVTLPPQKFSYLIIAEICTCQERAACCPRSVLIKRPYVPPVPWQIHPYSISYHMCIIHNVHRSYVTHGSIPKPKYSIPPGTLRCPGLFWLNCRPPRLSIRSHHHQPLGWMTPLLLNSFIPMLITANSQLLWNPQFVLLELFFFFVKKRGFFNPPPPPSSNLLLRAFSASSPKDAASIPATTPAAPDTLKAKLQVCCTSEYCNCWQVMENLICSHSFMKELAFVALLC